MLRALMNEVNSMQKQMGNVNKDMEILRKNQNKCLKWKSITTEMKNAFDGPMSGHGWAKTLWARGYINSVLEN